ncbi:MAG: organomercurial lyase [Pseudonocardiaceae bacterium]
MKLEILQVPGCPNVALLEERLDQALAGHGVRVERTHCVVTDLDAAAAVGMTGSPTLLVDGIDPFGELSLAPSVSCRLYRDEDGRVQGTPSMAALRRILGRAAADEELTACVDASGAVEDCCARPTDGSAASALRIWRGRAAPTDPAERAICQAILRAFAATGAPPDSGELDRVAAGFVVPAALVLDRLHTADVVRLGADGQVRVAYPFSAAPTRHRVRLPGGVEVYAMCAIDAVGIPAMLSGEAVITTAEPVSGAPITVTVTGGRFVWDPASAVVFVGVRHTSPGRS